MRDIYVFQAQVNTAEIEKLIGQKTAKSARQDGHHIWSGTIAMPIEQAIEYQMRQEKGDKCFFTIQPGRNHPDAVRKKHQTGKRGNIGRDNVLYRKEDKGHQRKGSPIKADNQQSRHHV